MAPPSAAWAALGGPLWTSCPSDFAFMVLHLHILSSSLPLYFLPMLKAPVGYSPLPADLSLLTQPYWVMGAPEPWP